LIQITAKKQVGWYGYAESDRDDLEQQIAMEVVRRRDKFNPGRAQQKTFLARLVTHAMADIIAARKASSRDYRREDGSLDQWVQDDAGDWARRGDTVTEDDAGRRTGRPDMSRGDQHDLAIDLADAASRLSPRLREIFEHYAVLGSAREVAKATGLHHSSVCDALKQIKQQFKMAGLGEYLSWHSRE
jgi:RNA polymerase sigma factor (sigma-70 family)